MAYTPNFTDARVRRRCVQAIAFVKRYLDAFTPRPCARTQIDKFLGKSTKDLGKYLRSQLLIVKDPHWNMHTARCKQYTYNAKNILALQNLLNPPQDQSAQVCYLQRGDEVRLFLTEAQQIQLESAQFLYKDKSQRLWNDIQNIPTQFREPILAAYGYQHQYDIETAAPRLLSQLALSLSPQEQFPVITDYLANKDRIRNQIAQHTGASPEQIKQIITGLFSGARIGRNLRFSLVQRLQLDIHTAGKISDHAWIRSLRTDIRRLWQIIGHDLPRNYKPGRSGKARALPLESKRKWAIYFRLEREVMSVIQDYLSEHNHHYFIEHDGWVSRQSVDIQSLCDLVQSRTGYQIQLKYRHLDQIPGY